MTFQYAPLFPHIMDATPYRKLGSQGVSVEKAGGRTFLNVAPEALRLLAEQAMIDINHLLRPGHLAQLAKILDDPEATSNDQFVAFDLLKNANIAAGGRAADVPGHRHRDRDGQARALRDDGRRG